MLSLCFYLSYLSVFLFLCYCLSSPSLHLYLNQSIYHLFTTSQKAKFEEKAKLMNEGLSELIDTPLTILGNGEKSRTEQYVSTSEENKDVIEAKLRKVETVKRRDRQRAQKLSDELDEMRKENEKLKKMCEELQNRVKEKVSLLLGLLLYIVTYFLN